MKIAKSKNYGGVLADIPTLLHMPIELFRQASNNNTKGDANTDTIGRMYDQFSYWSNLYL